MKWGALGYVLALAFGVLLALATRDGQKIEKAALQQIEAAEAVSRIWQAKYAEQALTVQRGVDTVTVRVASVRTLRDTLRLTDTVQVLAYIERADSALSACTEFVTNCELFRATADSTVNALSREKEFLREYAESVKPSWIEKHWWVPALGGVAFGAWLRGRP